MKKLYSLALLLIMSCCAGLNAQELNDNDRYQQQLKVEKKIAAYIQENFETAVPEQHLYNYIEQLRTADEHTKEELNATPLEELIIVFKTDYLRSRYFKENPNEVALFKAIMAPLCVNGDFESGGTTFGGFGSTYSGESAMNSGIIGQNQTECDIIPAVGNGLNFNPEILGLDSNTFRIMNGTDVDDVIPALDPTNGDNTGHSARINAPIGHNGASTDCSPSGGTNKLVKLITLQEAGNQEIQFNYALVSETPGHDPRSPSFVSRNPFFTARVLDANGNELDRFCIESNPTSNPFFTVVNNPPSVDGCNFSQGVVWQDWTCASLNVNGAVNDVLTLEIIVADCGAGGHFGYAYVDDICTDTCSGGTNTPGNIELTPMDPCQDLPLQVCGTYTLPELNGSTGTISNPIELDILQGGVSVGTTLTTVASNGTFCFTVNAADMVGQSGGYDFQVNADFGINGGTQADSDVHTNPGQDNDYIFDNPDCCPEDATFNAFIDTGGLLAISSFTDYSGFNPTHEWYVLSSPNASGGPYTPVYSVQDNGPATINLISNAQSGLYYTIIHILKSKDCPDVCESKVLYYNEFTRIGEEVNLKSIVDCCLVYQYWANGPGDTSELSGEFQKALDFNNNITTNVLNPYSNHPGITHSWELYSSPNQNGGPYTLVDSQTGLNYSYGPITDGIFYFILHKVQTDCGEVCYVQDICSNCTNSRAAGISGEIDCDFFTVTTSDCVVTPKHEYSCRSNSLDWASVPGALGYIIEINYNDPDCCIRSTTLPTSQRFEVGPSTTTLSIPVNSTGCFSYRIGTICADSKELKWTTKECVQCPVIQEACVAPVRTSFDCNKGIISWSGSSSYNNYVVEYTYNDPDCCRSIMRPVTQTVNVTGTSLQIRIPVGSYCLSYRIGTICPDSREPKWTDKVCKSCLGISTPKSTSVSPNPNDGLMNLNFESESEKLKKIDIHTINGVLVKSIQITDYKGTTSSSQWDGADILEKGIYFVSFHTAQGKTTEKVIIK
ncbi:putative secreted protein (Por secretion system target) [Nonlabens xylanidelens]|uniref:Putative secreted protein (Por secretion system target) n=1 Tax=Nonlabens xylanidelens TaxID=191564 RepID=A0A2S6IFN4_9FLAO|nr:T9SS type A sorting domain-containing protein [Nonlabens xylanidelens]PPK93021.1 putative secreted protein (Por secretion system target) [Nonlabens xylanidelens]PQJ18771.1 hypothetical protein BST94_07070 [Nonlabens xylanidelens]